MHLQEKSLKKSMEDEINENDHDEKISPFMAAINIFKGSIGTGILGLPYSVKNCGILVGTISLALLGIVTVYCMNLIVICSRYLCKKHNTKYCDFGDVAELSMNEYGQRAGYTSRLITDIFIIFTQVGFLCVYVVFIWATVDHYLKLEFNTLIVAVNFVLLLLITSTTNIVIIGYFSTAASLIQCISLSLLFVYLAAHYNGSENLKLVGDYKTLPLFFGTAMFAFEGIALILPIENTMKKRNKFFLVLDMSMGVVCILYITSGFLGYAAFGEKVRGSVTLNLPHNILNTIIQVCYIFAIFLSYPIQFYVPIKIIDKYLSLEYNTTKNKIIRAIIKFMLVSFTCIAAVLIPRIENLLSLCGSLAASSISLIFPSLFHLFCFKNVKSVPKIILCLDVLIIFVGLAGSIVGTYAAFIALFQSNDPFNPA